jgi:hypothetical protein
LVISAIFFDQHQFIVALMNLDHSNISDEDLVEVIKLSIEFSDEYHEWYLDLYVSIYFTNNKRYFKNYRQINNYTASTIISDIFSIKEIRII